MSKDIILLVDEMFLQKMAQYYSGEYVGKNEQGELYKGIVAFMVVGLKKSIPYVIQATPEVTFTGAWLAEMIDKNLLSISYQLLFQQQRNNKVRKQSVDEFKSQKRKKTT